MSTSVYKTSHDLMCEVLRGALLTVFESGAAGGIGSVPCRAGAALYALLMDHPIDRRGRCRACCRPRAVLGWRRRRCRVHIVAHLYLRGSRDFLSSHLPSELGQRTRRPRSVPAEGEGHGHQRG
ncbi:MAG: hypothetical protein ACRDS1_10045 [Pseudonocardiaceae bacterium]